jgi:hypothetical protein
VRAAVTKERSGFGVKTELDHAAAGQLFVAAVRPAPGKPVRDDIRVRGEEHHEVRQVGMTVEIPHHLVGDTVDALEHQR